MYILKNAWISITRNKGRNILIGIIIVVIACACTITLAINNTANDLISSYKKKYQKELSITFNRDKMKENMDFSNKDSIEESKDKFEEIKNYTVTDIEKFSKNKHITSYYYTEEISLNGRNLNKVESTDNSDTNRGGPKDNKQDNQLDFSLIGYSSQEAMSEFISGQYKISKIATDAWDKAFDGNYVFINEELATYNNLTLGDKITLKDSDDGTYEFEIIGIFKENSSSSDEASLFSKSANTLITNTNSLTSITENNENIKSNIKPTFIIDSYNSVTSIQKYFYSKGLDENYSVETNEKEISSSLDSIQNVKSFSTTFLVITLGIGGTVLFILNMINIRERKYEIGVLRTIGVSKFKLTLQFISELMIVAIVSLLLGAAVGTATSKPISNSLLKNEIKSSNSNREELKNNFGGQIPDRKGGPNDQMSNSKNISAYKSIDAVVDMKVILELLGIGTVLVLISSLSAMISIQRFSPLTILKERS